jgi:hypothetical protein
LPPRPQRLPPLRAFHLSASRSQPARAEALNFEFYTLFGIVSTIFNLKILNYEPKHSFHRAKIYLFITDYGRNAQTNQIF